MKQCHRRLAAFLGKQTLFSQNGLLDVVSERRGGGAGRGERNECGPMYINIGDGGNREGLNDFLDPQPDWSAAREPSYGHGARAPARHLPRQ